MSMSTQTPKTTFIATAPDGTEISRTTARVYTHAVLVEVENREGETRWGSYGFNGREDLALKEAAKWQDYLAEGNWVRRGGIEERSLRTLIVPVFPKEI